MRAVVCRQFGGPEELAIEDRPMPAPRPGEILVRVRAAGVTYADLVMIGGQYQLKVEPPFVPGMEIAGEVAAVGEGVTGWRLGQRVAALADLGGFAEAVGVPASRVLALPDGLGFVKAAGTFVNYGTAYGSLHWRASIRPGETCLVLGGAGGVGLAAIVLAKAHGARVIGAASSAERCALMTAHGADETVDYGSTSLRDRVLALTGKRGADVIVDPVGGDTGGLALRCVAWGGRIVTLGFTAGAPPIYPANILLVKNAAVLGMFFGSYFDARPDRLREGIGAVHRGLMNGTIRTYDIATREFEALPDVLHAIRSRQLTGKTVLTL